MIGITFVVGLTMGILAVFVIQNTVRLGEKSTEYSTHGEVVQTSTTSANRIPTTDRIDVGQFQEIFKQDSISEQYSVLHATLSQATEQELTDWWNQSITLSNLYTEFMTLLDSSGYLWSSAIPSRITGSRYGCWSAPYHTINVGTGLAGGESAAQ